MAGSIADSLLYILPLPLQADWPFYMGLSLFRLASILAGVGARAAQGNASSLIAAQVCDRFSYVCAITSIAL